MMRLFFFFYSILMNSMGLACLILACDILFSLGLDRSHWIGVYPGLINISTCLILGPAIIYMNYRAGKELEAIGYDEHMLFFKRDKVDIRVEVDKVDATSLPPIIKPKKKYFKRRRLYGKSNKQLQDERDEERRWWGLD